MADLDAFLVVFLGELGALAWAIVGFRMMEVSLPLSVAADHPAYAGHFPGQPILPGVVLLDEALHALAVRQGLEGAVGQIKSAKFPSPVTPGEALRLRYVETTAGFFRFEVTAGERLAASGVFAFAATGSGTAAE